MRQCHLTDYAQYAVFKCHHEPHYLLARNCNRLKDSPTERRTCKIDESLDFLLNAERAIFDEPLTRHVLLASDDSYFRPDQLSRWLHSLDNSGISQYPIISSPDGKLTTPSGLPGEPGCKEIKTRIYDLPIVMNRALLAKIRSNATFSSIQALTKGLNTTYDVALGVFAWMLEANHLVMPGVNVNRLQWGITAFKPTDMVVYHTIHADHERCDGGEDNKWLPKHRYAQNLVVGCGDLAQAAPRHSPIDRANMYDAWEYFRKQGREVMLEEAGTNGYIQAHVVLSKNHAVKYVLHEADAAWEKGFYEWDTYFTNRVVLLDGTRYKLQPGEVVSVRVVPRLVPLRGYRNTEHSVKNENNEKWEAYTLQDCRSAGYAHMT